MGCGGCLLLPRASCLCVSRVVKKKIFERRMKRNCHICKEPMVVELRSVGTSSNHSSGMKVLVSDDGSLWCNRWFCHACLKEMHVDDMFDVEVDL